MTLTIPIELVPIKTDPQGVVRVAKTRVTLDTLVIAFLEGCMLEEIEEQYPSLQLADIYSIFILDLPLLNSKERSHLLSIISKI